MHEYHRYKNIPHEFDHNIPTFKKQASMRIHNNEYLDLCVDTTLGYSQMGGA